MRTNSLTRVISAGVALLSLVWITTNPAGGCGPGFDPHPHEAVGMVMAHQALKMHKTGGLITVIKRDTAAFNNPAADAQFESFSKVLKKANVPIDSVRLIQVDSLSPLAVPPGDFTEIIRKSGDNDVVVSFMGPPILDAAQRATLPEKGGAQVIAFCPGNIPERSDLAGLIRDGMVQAAVISKPNVAIGANHPDSLQAWFDLLYQEVTPANAATVLSTASKP
jgi:hypothetical protein